MQFTACQVLVNQNNWSFKNRETVSERKKKKPGPSASLAEITDKARTIISKGWKGGGPPVWEAQTSTSQTLWESTGRVGGVRTCESVVCYDSSVQGLQSDVLSTFGSPRGSLHPVLLQQGEVGSSPDRKWACQICRLWELWESVGCLACPVLSQGEEPQEELMSRGFRPVSFLDVPHV